MLQMERFCVEVANTVHPSASFRRWIGLQAVNTLRTVTFKLFKSTFPGSKQFKSTFILCFFKNL